jgi:hypothetical protein
MSLNDLSPKPPVARMRPTFEAGAVGGLVTRYTATPATINMTTTIAATTIVEIAFLLIFSPQFGVT